jgi:GrpB-like predicted nucleotidyltransferase (UPF0157 family)
MKNLHLHIQLVSYQENWTRLFQEEKVQIQVVFVGYDIKDIQHIGSTSIPGIKSKPIIDIAVLIDYPDNHKEYTQKLTELGYEYDEQASSSERYFYRKYNEKIGYHISIAFTNKGEFWKRQILFRDYLINHPEYRDEYEKIKEQAIAEDSTGRQLYIGAKTNFVLGILSQAEKEDS